MPPGFGGRAWHAWHRRLWPGTPASAGLRFSKESRMLDFVGVDRDRIVGLKQLLVEQVEGSSDWRARKAVEYHDNAGSNLRASEGENGGGKVCHGSGGIVPLSAE